MLIPKLWWNFITVCKQSRNINTNFSTQNIESKCKLKPQTNWINTILVLNYLEPKINLCYFSVDYWVHTIVALLKQHNFSVERYINHFKDSNQYYLKLNVDQYCKSIDWIDTKIALNQHYFAKV
jgi:hypothetical protein